MRRKLIILVAALQVFVLIAMAAKREYVHAYGQQIYLRSAPIDPRDPFRGDFVRLNYAMSEVTVEDMHGGLAEHKSKRGRVVYAALKADGNGLHSLDYVSDKAPQRGVYLKGRTDSRRFGAADRIRINYGIEQYFVQQGKGLEMEKKLGTRSGLQVPIEMQLAVGGDGTAVITGHRWSRLGVQLEVMRRGGQSDLSPAIRVTLRNVSDQPLSLANPGSDCGFHLVDASRDGPKYEVADSQCQAVQIKRHDLIALQPGAAYSVDIDLSAPRWHVHDTQDGDTQEIGAIASDRPFRLEYRSPEASVLEQLDQAHQLWLGILSTPSFNSLGHVD